MDGVTLFIILMVSPFLTVGLVKVVLYFKELWKERNQSPVDTNNTSVIVKHKHFKGVPRKSATGTRNQSQEDADFYDAFIWWCKVNGVSSKLFEDSVEEALVHDKCYVNISYAWYVYRRLVKYSRYLDLINKALGDDVELLDDFDQLEGSRFYKAIPKFLENMEKQISAINFQFGDNLKYVEKYSKNINYELLTKPFVVDTMSLHKLDTPLN